jgi:hypothetical protein
MKTLEEIFGKIKNDFSPSDFLQMQIRWRWKFDKNEKGRMIIYANGENTENLLTIISREINGKVWASHTGTFHNFSTNLKFKDFIIGAEWGKIFLSAVENYDISKWKKNENSYYYVSGDRSMPLKFSIEKLDHEFDIEYRPNFFGKYSLEIMGNHIVFDSVENAKEGAKTFLVMLSSSFGLNADGRKRSLV